MLRYFTMVIQSKEKEDESVLYNDYKWVDYADWSPFS